MRKIASALLLSVTFVSPLAALAAGTTFAGWVNGGLVPFVDNYVIKLLYAVLFLLFIFGVFRYFFVGSNEEQREQGKKFLLWSVIALVAVFSVWGVVNLLLNVLTF